MMKHSHKQTMPDVGTEETVSQRRAFLKKAVYAAPTLMVLGGLVKPTQTHAGFGPPPSDPNGLTATQSGTEPSDSGSNDVVATTLGSNGNSDNDIVAQTLGSSGL